jgi:hypothetical protein
MNQHTKIEVFVMYGKGFKKVYKLNLSTNFDNLLRLLTLDKALQIMGVVTTKPTKKGVK